MHSLSNHPQASAFSGPLSEAVRPADPNSPAFHEGYRITRAKTPGQFERLPLLRAAIAVERGLAVLLDCLEPLGDMVHVILESSHSQASGKHVDLRRDLIDRPVLASYLCEFEELLLRDGCTGIAVVATEAPLEVQFDEHKLIYVYGDDLRPFRRVLRHHGIAKRPGMPLITEVDHLHYSTPVYADAFEELAYRLGVVDYHRILTDENF